MDPNQNESSQAESNEADSSTPSLDELNLLVIGVNQVNTSAMFILESASQLIRIHQVWMKDRIIGFYENIVKNFTDSDFKANFRVTRNIFNNIVINVKPFMDMKTNNFRETIPIDKRVAIGLYT